MPHKKLYKAVGLMSGTSLDGVDAALIETDGHDRVHVHGFVHHAYPEELRDQVRALFGRREDPDGTVTQVAKDLTAAHLEAILELLAATGTMADEVDVIGFHGQTITHDPVTHFTWQIGLPEMLVESLGRPVVFNFRMADIRAGGQGAPLIPIYHHALARQAGLDLPIAVLNLGGVANITFLPEEENRMIAFDTGPGGALLDDFIYARMGIPFDDGGKTAKAGQPNRNLLERWLADPYFQKPPPKSLDRNAWDVSGLADLFTPDGAATLALFTAASVRAAFSFFPEKPRRLLVTGGGRHNQAIMDDLAVLLPCPVESVDAHGWNGDALEAEGFAYMAVRRLLGLHITFPGTTGVPIPMVGGKIFGLDSAKGA